MRLLNLQKTLLFLTCICTYSIFYAQNYGVLPFTGATFKEEGIKFKDIEITLEDNTWISNKLPIDKSFEIKMKNPVGFEVINGMCFPGISILVCSKNGDTLGYAPNIYGDYNEGLEFEYLKSLTVKLGYNEQSKVGDTLSVNVVFFDSKGTRKTSVDMTNIIVNPILPLNTTNSTYSSKSYTGYRVNSTVEAKHIETNDTIIKGEKYQFFSINHVIMSPVVMDKMKSIFTVYDSNCNVIDPKSIGAEIILSKDFDTDNYVYKLIYLVKKNPAIKGQFYWSHKHEFLKANDAIEVFNVF